VFCFVFTLANHLFQVPIYGILLVFNATIFLSSVIQIERNKDITVCVQQYYGYNMVHFFACHLEAALFLDGSVQCWLWNCGFYCVIGKFIWFWRVVKEQSVCTIVRLDYCCRGWGQAHQAIFCIILQQTQAWKFQTLPFVVLVCGTNSISTQSSISCKYM